ncbi:hypothetical protein CFH99_10135 [Nocardioides aromaticivorans]|nr:hypothetical protein CFH99_10135 [Nocardioides aromaticivorans]
MAGGLAGTALALVGCDAVDGLLDDDESPGVSGAVSPTAPAVDADSDLVASVLDAVTATGALATAVGTTVPALAGVATRLARLHDAHATELGGAEQADAPAVPAGRAAALRRLAQAETRLQDRLVRAAGQAESGALAQVLASMAAAVAQQRAVLA